MRYKLRLEKRDPLFIAFTLLGLTQLVLFIRTFLGSDRAEWGYNEFLINYSAGFTRRGLPGTLLIVLHNLTGVDPYYVVVSSLTLIVTCITILFAYLVWHSQMGTLASILIIFHPALLLSPLLSRIFVRKDWLIIFGLILHVLLIKLLASKKIYYSRYLSFLSVLIVYLIIVTLSQEIEILILPAHLVLISESLRFLPDEGRSGAVHKKAKQLLFSNVIVFALTIIYNGNPRQAVRIFKNLPSDFNAAEKVIASNGWTVSENFELVQTMFRSPSTLIVYAICILIGPFLIYLLLRKTQAVNYMALLISITPLMALFVLGWDWGRWIVIISFVTFSMLIALDKSSIDLEPICVKPSKCVMTRETTLGALLVLFIYLVSLMWQIPSCCPQGLKGFASPVLARIIKVWVLRASS